MEKIKEMPRVKQNSQKEKMTKEKAIEILEREIPEDQMRLLKKQGALEILKQLD